MSHSNLTLRASCKACDLPFLKLLKHGFLPFGAQTKRLAASQNGDRLTKRVKRSDVSIRVSAYAYSRVREDGGTARLRRKQGSVSHR